LVHLSLSNRLAHIAKSGLQQRYGSRAGSFSSQHSWPNLKISESGGIARLNFIIIKS